MPPHTVPRILLSLLMLWQLSASVLAHSIMETPKATAVTSEHCHEQMQNMGNASMDLQMQNSAAHAPSHSHGSPLHSDGCKSGCKCPCAGTPALSFVLPAAVIAAPEALSASLFVAGFDSTSLANLLRPPI